MDVQMRDVETEADGSSDNDSETNIDSGIDKSGGTSAVNVDSDDETDSEDGSNNDDEDEGIDTGDSGSFPHHDGPLLPKIKMKLSSQPSPPPRRLEASSPSKAEGRKDVTAPTSTTSPIRIKLSLKKLPISGNKVIETDAAKKVGSPSTPSKGASAVKTTKGGGKAAPKALSTIPKAATGTASKRRSLLPPKQVRFPPIPSPGLRLLRPPIPMPSSDSYYYTPQQVFAVTMTAAGYTVEERTRRPHRGSSVQRTVDDLFDTNVLLALHPLELVPSALWHHSVVSSDRDNAETSEYTTLPQLLIRGLEEPERTPLLEREQQSSAVDESGSRKRPRRPYAPMPFRDMVPVSLTIPYPESYIQKRKDYVAQVKHREACIVQWQAAQDEFELSQDAAADTMMHSGADSDGEGLGTTTASPSSKNSRSAAFVNPITVPPIPEPPEPPRLEELRAPSSDNVLETEERWIPSISPLYYLNTDEDASKNHPIYLPKGKEDLVAHLDPHCFHITEGRYFGLRTNRIADPNFVGPSAPGLASTNTTTGGLATATTSTTTSTSGLTGGGMTMILSASFHSAAAVPAAHGKEDTTTAAATKSQTDTEPSETGREPPAAPSATASSVDGAAPVDMSPSTAYDPTNGTAYELRKIMEGSDTALIETFQEAIVRAVVYAFRTHQPQTTAFRAPNGKTYPDIGKAFAIYGGVKTCDRCKSNKQGVFHCRIRRRHDDPDFDGGVTSTALLRPLLDAPLETLLLKEES